MRTGKKKGGHTDQDAGDHRSAHDISVKPQGQRDSAGHLADNVEWQHERAGLDIGLEIGTNRAPGNRKERNRNQNANGERGSGRERAGRRLVPGHDAEVVGGGDKQEQRAYEGQLAAGILRTNLIDLIADRGDDHLEQNLPAGDGFALTEPGGDSPGAESHKRHYRPVERDGRIQLPAVPVVQDPSVGAYLHIIAPTPGSAARVRSSRAKINPATTAAIAIGET